MRPNNQGRTALYGTKIKNMKEKNLLHVGPGHRNNGAKLPRVFQMDNWREIRLDIDPLTEPDVIGSIIDMRRIANASIDAIYSSHNIEHIYDHETAIALGEFMRVLKPDGFILITCPDLQTACELIAKDRLNEAAYISPAGPVTPRDILYGHSLSIKNSNHYMAHKNGFTLKTLTEALDAAGFKGIAGKRSWESIALWLVATKYQINENDLIKLARDAIP